MQSHHEHRRGTVLSSHPAQIENWPVKRLDELEIEVVFASENDQNLFIWDKTGGVPSEFETFGVNNEFTCKMVDVALAKRSIDTVLGTALESLRAALVSSMEAGSPFLINLGMLNPDFYNVYTRRRIFPAADIFDLARLRSRSVLEPLARITRAQQPTEIGE